MASSQGRSSDQHRTNNGLVYVSLTTKNQAVAQGYVADIQPRACPTASSLPDGSAP